MHREFGKLSGKTIEKVIKIKLLVKHHYPYKVCSNTNKCNLNKKEMHKFPIYEAF